MVGAGDDNEMDSFRILNWEWTKVIPLSIFQTVDQGTSTKTTQNGIYFIFSYHPKKKSGIIRSADRLRITAINTSVGQIKGREADNCFSTVST